MVKVRIMHIPKTGGSTLVETICNQMGSTPDKEFQIGPEPDPVRNAECWQSIPVQQRRQIHIIYGHAPVITGIPEIDEFPIITMLREPISRYKSLCQHVCDGKSPELLEHFPPGETFDLDNFLDSGFDLGLDNIQTKFLINETGKYLSSDRIKMLGSAESAAETAKQVLFDKTVFGLQEYYNQSLALYEPVLQCKLQPPAILYNEANYKAIPSSRRLTFSEKQLERIRQLNMIDIMVYQTAKLVFLAKLASKGNS